MKEHDNILRPIAIQVGRKVLFNKIHDIVDRIVVILSCVAVGFYGGGVYKICRCDYMSIKSRLFNGAKLPEMSNDLM